jgi:hypothetical protein
MTNPSVNYLNKSHLDSCICDWIHAEGLPFSIAESTRFKLMIKKARTVGNDYKPPHRNFISNELLEINFEKTMASNYEKIQREKKFGYQAMGDGATIGKMPLCNELWSAGDCAPLVFGVHDCTGHMAAGGKKDAEYIANLFEERCNKLDPDNAEGLIDLIAMDGASNVQKGARILNIRYPTSHTIHGVEHVMSLFFDDVAKQKAIKVRVFDFIFHSFSHIHSHYSIFFLTFTSI